MNVVNYFLGGYNTICTKCKKNYVNPGKGWCQKCYDKDQKLKQFQQMGPNCNVCTNCMQAPANKGYQFCESCYQTKQNKRYHKQMNQPQPQTYLYLQQQPHQPQLVQAYQQQFVQPQTHHQHYSHASICTCCKCNVANPKKSLCAQCYQVSKMDHHMIEKNLPPNWTKDILCHDFPAMNQHRGVCSARLFFMSDTHCEHEHVFKKMEHRLKKGNGGVYEDNILIHCGDWTQLGSEDQTKKFCDWLNDSMKYFKYVILVSGNHERTCGDKWENKKIEDYVRYKCGPNVIFLTFKAVIFKEYEELTIAGLSWWDSTEIQSTFKNFQSLPDTRTVIRQGHVADNIDPLKRISFLISHHPPYGVLDDWNGNHKGSKRIVGYLQFLEQSKMMPEYHVFGHVHRLGKPKHEIIKKSNKHNITHINVAQSIGIMDYYHN